MNPDETAAAIEELAGTPRFLGEALAQVPRKAWDRHAPGVDFTLRQQLCHLRDVELEGYLVRVVRMAAETAPRLIDLDGTRLARERHYESQDPTLAVEDFAALRALTTAKLRALPAEAWTRTGAFAAGEPFDLGELAAMMIAHDREHCGEIAALIAASLESS